MAHVAYFSMEIALRSDLPTYSGGLGVLAGDTIRSAADLRIPMVAVSLLYRKGYFAQRLDPSGWQHEEPVVWVVEDVLKEQPPRVTVTMAGRPVQVRAWRYDVTGVGGSTVPVLFLDTDLPENAPEDRALTHTLYGGDPRYRFCQEVILGIGGVRMLRALGYEEVQCFHLNEGHASLLALELLDERAKRSGRGAFTSEDVDAVRQQCVFTTHTPVPAGHDQFPMELVTEVLGPREDLQALQEVFCCEGQFNMTYVALHLSRYVNGVAKQHGEISRMMFANHKIDSITNGVHLATWAAPPFQALFDRYAPGWKEDNFSLRHALNIPRREIWDAHRQAKRRLIQEVNRRTNAGMDVEAFTLGFARRAAPYKRADLFFHDLERLKALASAAGALQVIYAGKAHPQDQGGKELIQRIFQAREALRPHVKVAYLENYDLEAGRLITSGVDVWLNTPQPPLEASGTSGMKAALNGVPSLSVLDGWWIEGHIEGVTGWAIDGEETDAEAPPARDDAQDARALYEKLERDVLPLYSHVRDRFIDVMRHAIALNGSFFNTQRMVQEYVVNAYFL
ncbi:MAG: alpha-glucan family phosphorylase [Candidatus Omnitrophica bacterium]|nr:alpha-glucan family phosphorylase [Candidatus Omnitrophota bacterium]